MAITTPKTQIPQPDSENRRTRKVTIEREGNDFTISMIREITPMSNGETLAGGSEFGIARKLSAVADQFVDVNKTMLTVAQIAEAIAAFGDKWDREDNHLTQ